MKKTAFWSGFEKKATVYVRRKNPNEHMLKEKKVPTLRSPLAELGAIAGLTAASTLTGGLAGAAAVASPLMSGTAHMDRNTAFSRSIRSGLVGGAATGVLAGTYGILSRRREIKRELEQLKKVEQSSKT